MEIVQPQPGHHETWRPSDASVEATMQTWVDAVTAGRLTPEAAVQLLSRAANSVSRPDQGVPSALSAARKLLVSSQALCRVVPLTDACHLLPDLRWDTLEQTEIVAQRLRTLGLPTFHDQWLGDVLRRGKRHLLLNSIDQQLLGFSLKRFASSVRNSDWETLGTQPLAVQPALEFDPLTVTHPQHQAAMAHFAASLGAEIPDERLKLLRQTLETATGALLDYNHQPGTDPIALGQCRLLAAKALLGAAELGEFDDNGGRVAANQAAVKLLWQTGEDLAAYLDEKTAQFTHNKLQNLRKYNEAQLQALRSVVLRADWYAAGQDTRRECEALRARYAEAVDEDAATHEPATVTSLPDFARCMSRAALNAQPLVQTDAVPLVAA